MTGGTGGKATTTTLFTRLTRGTASAIIVVIQTTSGQNAPRRGSRIVKGIIFTRMTAARGINPLKLQGFTDADWQGGLDDRKSTSGYLFAAPLYWAISRRSSKELCLLCSTFIYGN
ncbi:hypothetical protein VPH35_011369 [Triticum aestivum]